MDTRPYNHFDACVVATTDFQLTVVGMKVEDENYEDLCG